VRPGLLILVSGNVDQDVRERTEAALDQRIGTPLPRRNIHQKRPAVRAIDDVRLRPDELQQRPRYRTGEGRVQMHDGRPEATDGSVERHRKGDQRTNIPAAARITDDQPVVDAAEFGRLTARHQQTDVGVSQCLFLKCDNLLKIRTDPAGDGFRDMKQSWFGCVVHGVVRFIVADETFSVPQPITRSTIAGPDPLRPSTFAV
jgi:hypothetical protein